MEHFFYYVTYKIIFWDLIIQTLKLVKTRKVSRSFVDNGTHSRCLWCELTNWNFLSSGLKVSVILTSSSIENFLIYFKARVTPVIGSQLSTSVTDATTFYENEVFLLDSFAIPSLCETLSTSFHFTQSISCIHCLEFLQ